ncbi:MAG TPA: hypothetical protein VGI85_13605, partial [Chthoniobacterales bacterium]
MKNPLTPTRSRAFALMILLATAPISFARTEKDFFQNSDLANGSNYLPSGLPNASNDVVFTTPEMALELSGTNLSMGSVNQTGNQAYVVSNNDPGTTDSTLTLGSGDRINNVAPNPDDIIYVGGTTSTLAFQRLNGGDGIGVLRLDLSQTAGNFDVAGAGATLNISANMSIAAITKIGDGTLNIGGSVAALSGVFSVSQGTVNFLQGSMINTFIILNVSNPN